MSSSLEIIRDLRRCDLDADVGQTVFTFPRPLFDALDLRVLTKVEPATTFSVVASGYTVALAADHKSAVVTFDLPLRPSPDTPTTTVRLDGARIASRTTDVTRSGTIVAALLERELDLFAIIAQELRRDVNGLGPDTLDAAANAVAAAIRAEAAAARAELIEAGVIPPGAVGAEELAAGAVTLAKWAADAVAALAAKQPAADTLTLLAGLVPAAGKMPHFAGTGAVGLVDAGAAGLQVLAKPTAADILAYLGAGSLLNVRLVTVSGAVTPVAGAKKWLCFVQGGGAGGRYGGGSDGLLMGGHSGALCIGLVDVASGASVMATVGAGGPSNSAGGTASIGGLTANGGTAPNITVTSPPAAATATGGILNIPGRYGLQPGLVAGRGADSFFGGGGYGTTGTGANANGYGAGGAAGSNSNQGGAGSPACILILEFG